MNKKLLDLLEKHVDKLILGVIAIASLAVLWFFVIGSPYGAKYGQSKYGPGKIDAKIKEASERVDRRVSGDATVDFRKYKDSKATQMAKLLGGSIDIKDDIVIQMAGIETGRTEEKRFYSKPLIGAVENIDAELIRTAVFVPTEKVDMSKTYDDVATEVDDVDFVTVQASFDVAALYENFRNSFVDQASSEDKDENLAAAVFASVGIERQTLGEDGQWSDWEVIERPDIDYRKEMFAVAEKVEDVELGDVDLLLVNFYEFEVQKDLLQPEPYDIAASNAEWMTPTYHKELEEFVAKELEAIKKDAMERERAGGRGGADNMVGGGMGMMMGQGAAPGGRTRREPRRQPRSRRTTAGTSRRERTIEDVRADFEFIMLTEDIDMGRMKESLVFWAFDDNVETFGTYRYRMRIGVFNPTAGKDWFSGDDAAFKDDIVLWSDYSDVTGEITVDPMICFFPLDVDVAKKEAMIQVSKFHQGQWHSEEFVVQVGESIGKVVEIAKEEDEEKSGRRNRRNVVEEVETIDFSSGAILVDIVESKRTSNSRRSYYEILYSENEGDIKRLGVGKRNWSKALASTFNDIDDQKDVVVEILDKRDGSGRNTFRGGNNGDMGGFEMMGMPGGMMGGEF